MFRQNNDIRSSSSKGQFWGFETIGLKLEVEDHKSKVEDTAKSMSVKRAWPSPMGTSGKDIAMLFIEDALSNLDAQQEYTTNRDDELEIASLQKDGGLSFSRVKIKGMVGSYPFENLRSAIDILFLYGSSDLVVAKQAILLYYVFDRLWKIADDKWRYCVDDFSSTFNIARHSILESFTFYLLDDHSDESLQICSPNATLISPTSSRRHHHLDVVVDHRATTIVDLLPPPPHPRTTKEIKNDEEWRAAFECCCFVVHHSQPTPPTTLLPSWAAKLTPSLLPLPTTTRRTAN
ncbi:unnamed protein product [Lactuca virosa]|uniref:ELYS-like domain-containing protein n=1 Tax=Lactuca virosa TaxID=75947 RepID=A0AAU9NJJ2_9ASTR|nr:unnamed protein product [Lactuca virosa]